MTQGPGEPVPEPSAHLEIREGDDLRRVRVGQRVGEEIIWLTEEIPA